VPGATAGADACKCFSAGRWALDNLVPCFYTYNGEDIGAASSVNEGGMPKCVSMSKPLQEAVFAVEPEHADGRLRGSLEALLHAEGR
jgi:hypothetical protein